MTYSLYATSFDVYVVHCISITNCRLKFSLDLFNSTMILILNKLSNATLNSSTIMLVCE